MTNGGRWRVIAHVNEADALRTYRVARWALIGGIVATLMLIIASLIVIGRFIERRITGPAQRLAIAAEAVAAGDLSKEVNEIGGDDEIGRLAHGVSAMIDELDDSRWRCELTETVTMTSEITASSRRWRHRRARSRTPRRLGQQANIMARPSGRSRARRRAGGRRVRAGCRARDGRSQREAARACGGKPRATR
jgi:HAMP domain-containing protein